MVGYGQRDGCSRYPRWWDARCFGRVYSRRLAGGTTASIVVPANAGTHNPRCMLLRRVVATAFARQKAVADGVDGPLRHRWARIRVLKSQKRERFRKQILRIG